KITIYQIKGVYLRLQNIGGAVHTVSSGVALATSHLPHRGRIDMGVRSKASMVYVAFCVTLTCTATALITADFGSAEYMHPPSPQLFAERSPVLNPVENLSSRHISQRKRFFARAYRFNRNDRLANGGLSV
ncbi:MAG: hypothetical protein AAGL17_24025, partial [Cyanobacteria bacterium J06576_12]